MNDQGPSRDQAIAHFLAEAGWGRALRGALAGDASFRRYWRIRDGTRTAVLMDAPIDKLDIRPFLMIDEHLRGLGSSAPEILAADPATGLALLEDLGDATLARRLEAGDDPGQIFALAIDWLIDLHRRGTAVIPTGLPVYDDARLLEELERFILWYMPAVRGDVPSEAARTKFATIWRALLPVARAVPPSLVYRDFFVENLLLLPRPGLKALGLLDFQDSVAGPITYDLVSLLEDARRDLAPNLVAEMRERYLAAFPQLDWNLFDASWAVMAAHRHVKCLGLFVRLAKRDGKPGYMKHIPRLWRLLDRALVHPDLHDLAHWLNAEVPAERRVVPSL
jgi:N-acetylmuramate 1-kinase